ncbi:MAG: ribosome-associated translation inhibitor RaiA [Patescibacteria group bacterium]|nr:ribosome-associated translation inhibitor RaiA [Patescibacteria group bacterium]
MKVKFYLNGLKVKEKVKHYIRVRIAKLQKYFKNQTVSIEMEIEKDKRGIYRVEIQLRVPGSRYIGDAKAKTIKAAFDLARDGLSDQIRRKKEKRQTIERRGAISIKKKFSIDEGARF